MAKSVAAGSRLFKGVVQYFDEFGRKWAFGGGAYQGASFSRSRSRLPGVVQDAWRELNSYTRTELMRLARHINKNSGLIRAVGKKLVEYAIGPGIIPVPATEDQGWNEAAWDFFQNLDNERRRCDLCDAKCGCGSIGVFSALLDYVEWMKKEGLKLELMKAGRDKAMGLPGTSLTVEQRAVIQADVDEIFGWFTADVRSHRKALAAVPEESMQGQCFMGARAVAAGLADEVVQDLAAVIEDLEAGRL